MSCLHPNSAASPVSPVQQNSGSSKAAPSGRTKRRTRRHSARKAKLLKPGEAGPETGTPSAMCTVCFENPKDASIIHGNTGHQVCCYRCAKKLRRKGKTCPVCRRKIQKVIRNFIV